jgi:hypothetical protein
MAFDTSMYSQIKPIELQNPLAQAVQVAQFQHAQGQNELSKLVMGEKQREIADQQAVREALSGSNGDYKAASSALLSKGLYKPALEINKAQTEQQKSQAALEKDKIAAAKQKLEIAGQAFGYVRDNPTLEAANSTLDYLAANGIYSPEQVAQYKAHVAANPANIKVLADQAFRSVLAADKQLPNFQTRNTGATTDTLEINPVTGDVKVANSVKNTQSPDNVASTASAAAGRAQTERHFQAAQNAPQYIETDAGLVALPKKLAQGQAPVATPVTGADGQPLGKPLKQIPASVNTAILANNQSLNQIDRALTLLGGKDVGSMKGDKAATGVKGYLPNGLLNRVDPQGVDARAEISDIGSLRIHDRSGAAVTLSEAPRLMPFIPLATDDAATVKKKLTRLKT